MKLERRYVMVETFLDKSLDEKIKLFEQRIYDIQNDTKYILCDIRRLYVLPVYLEFLEKLKAEKSHESIF